MTRILSHIRHIRRHPAYDGVTTWIRYGAWLSVIIRRKTSVIVLSPYSAKVVVSPNLRGIGRLIFLFRATYEAELLVVRSLIKPGQTALDVGAHIGSHSFVIAELVGPSGAVIALEPLPEAFDALEKGIKVNGFKNVYPYQVAAGREPASGSLVRHQDRSRTRITTNTGDAQVQIVTLDALDVGPVDFVKIDVEGYEEEVVAGAEAVLAQSPHVLIEASRGGRVLHILRRMGYVCYIVKGDRIREFSGELARLSNVICIHHSRLDEVGNLIE